MEHYKNEANLPQRVGAYLKKELDRRDIRQEDFADDMFVEPRTVRRWMKSGVNSLTTLLQIADALHISLLDILRAA